MSSHSLDEQMFMELWSASPTPPKSDEQEAPHTPGEVEDASGEDEGSDTSDHESSESPPAPLTIEFEGMPPEEPRGRRRATHARGQPISLAKLARKRKGQGSDTNSDAASENNVEKLYKDEKRPPKKQGLIPHTGGKPISLLEYGRRNPFVVGGNPVPETHGKLKTRGKGGRATNASRKTATTEPPKDDAGIPSKTAKAPPKKADAALGAPRNDAKAPRKKAAKVLPQKDVPWRVPTFMSKANRADMELLLKDGFGEDPKSEPFVKMSARELAIYLSNRQQEYVDWRGKPIATAAPQVTTNPKKRARDGGNGGGVDSGAPTKKARLCTANIGDDAKPKNNAPATTLGQTTNKGKKRFRNAESESSDAVPSKKTKASSGALTPATVPTNAGPTTEEVVAEKWNYRHASAMLKYVKQLALLNVKEEDEVLNNSAHGTSDAGVDDNAAEQVSFDPEEIPFAEKYSVMKIAMDGSGNPLISSRAQVAVRDILRDKRKVLELKRTMASKNDVLKLEAGIRGALRKVKADLARVINGTAEKKNKLSERLMNEVLGDGEEQATGRTCARLS